MTTTELLDQQRTADQDAALACYRSLVHKAGALDSIPSDLLADLNDAADRLGYGSQIVSRQVGAVQSHVRVTASLPGLQKAVKDADRLAKVAEHELRTLNEKASKARQRIADAAVARQNLSTARNNLEGYEQKHADIFGDNQ